MPFAIITSQNCAYRECDTLAEGPKMDTISACECAPTLNGSEPLAIEDALELMLSRVRPLSETEIVPTFNGLGRVLAADIVSGIDVPGYDSSAMDGYAVRFTDVADYGGRLRVTQKIGAGSVGVPLNTGTAARIFTGAPIPEGADTVVIQEVCKRSGETVLVPAECKPGANIRPAGDDLRAGAMIAAAGTRLAPQHLGLAASVGLEQFRVYRRLKVAVLATGDELTVPGKPLIPGRIYNSNGVTLAALLRSFGCEVINLGIVRDTLPASMEALSRGALDADLVISTGGVSVGEEDHIKPAVQHLGELALWKVAMRPGKPLAFGRIGDTPFFGAPGNPVSLFVVFCLFVRPILLRMQGFAGDLAPRTFRLRAGFDWPKPDKRREFHRGRIRTGRDGAPELEVFSSRSSGVLSSVAWAEGLVEIPEGRAIRCGDSVNFMPFEQLLG
jgi:molybdopterin molybdotransferase